MRFFRRLSSPVVLTLIAVAMQATMLLAHAHVHRHPPAMAATLMSGKTASMACRAIVPPSGCTPAAPSQRHDDCPLCWSLAASGAGVLPSPLMVIAVEAPKASPRPLPGMPVRSDAGASHFQARAPPAA